MITLITRPEPDASRLAAGLEASGVSTLVDPLLEIEFLLKPVDLSKFHHIITTSANAIRALAAVTNQRHFPLWVVGSASAQIAKELGFTTVHQAGGDVNSLLKNLLFTKPQGPFLYARGDVIRHDLAQIMKAQGFVVQEAIVYQSQPAMALRSETLAAMDAGILHQVLFFSPRTAQIFEKLCHFHHRIEACKTIRAVCHSEAIQMTVAAGDLPWKEIVLMCDKIVGVEDVC